MRVETALIIAEKILFVGLLMTVGFLCGKLGLIDRELNRKASELLLLVVSPCLIFASYQVEYDAALLGNLLLAFGLSVGSFAVQLLCAHLLLPRRRPDAAVEQLSVVYPNCMFLGIPLIEALYGAEGVLYLTAYITCFNVLIWTHGVIVMDGRFDRRQLLKKLCSPALIAIAAGLVLFLLRVRLPGWLLEPVRSISGMNTPLAMLIAGATISQTPLRSCVLERRLYRVLAIRMLAVPALLLAAFWALPVPVMPKMAVFLAAACPTASYCTMFALRYGHDGGYAARIFALTTLSAAVCLPLMALAVGLLF